ncbi:predicted protein [Botrytis cinerea T4]|uniref:Uncharacterized protein n=1 Tax=Botryotinia fuckeliana (strain T4) TaxID=999810 RepID=G2YQV2_BOTF4|nr:predicted protein [Botrytis cinerea T4]
MCSHFRELEVSLSNDSANYTRTLPVNVTTTGKNGPFCRHTE